MTVIAKRSLAFAILGLLSYASVALAGNTEEYCYDDPWYAYQGKYCEEIAKKGLCDEKLGDGDIIGEVYCPVSCDTCYKTYDESYLVTTKDCYEYGESIEATYANVNPHGHDAVAIYPIDDVAYDKTPYLWKWLCDGGDEGHYCKCFYGSIIMNGDTAYGTWPLEKKSYKIVLKRAGPYEEIIASDTFKVGDCSTHKPTPSPTKHVYPTAKPVPAPTPSPTKYHTDYPTYYHTDYPTECEDVVYSDLDCYGKGELIEVYFDQCWAKPYDWIAIYPGYFSGDDLPEETLVPWQFVCGDQWCSEKGEYGFVTFKDDTTGPWPLTPGPYKAFLIREGEAPYAAVAESYEFWVKEKVEECYDHYPTPAPSKHDCTSYVSTVVECYDTDDTGVLVDFKSCDAGSKDWIGIYYASDNPYDLGYPLAWAWIACGKDTDCDDSTAYSALDVIDVTGYVEFVGLPDGEYRAHLIKELYPFPGYEAEASSDKFFVKQLCYY
ncbi:MAG: hypothetical protein SGILL_006280 [Bacillariaceae sp.]